MATKRSELAVRPLAPSNSGEAWEGESRQQLEKKNESWEEESQRQSEDEPETLVGVERRSGGIVCARRVRWRCAPPRRAVL